MAVAAGGIVAVVAVKLEAWDDETVESSVIFAAKIGDSTEL